MRIYNDFKEAFSEIERDLVEMGIKIHPATYQDKDVKDDPNFDTLELQNYIYTVTHPEPVDLKPVQPYSDVEWFDRLRGINGEALNPGNAWRERPDVWMQFMEKDGTFAYTYPERLAQFEQVKRVAARLQQDPDSRQLFISIWRPSDIEKIGGLSRVPCSLGYQIQVRKNELNLTYLQRSCDFKTHMQNDVYLAVMMQRYLATWTNYKVGKFTHWVGSLHIFRKDGEGVF